MTNELTSKVKTLSTARSVTQDFPKVPPAHNEEKTIFSHFKLHMVADIITGRPKHQ